MDTKQMLNHLSGLRVSKEEIDKEEMQLIEEQIPEDIQKEIDDIKAEFKPQHESINQQIQRVTESIKINVLMHGESVKGEHLIATYSNGRISWDTKSLNKAIELIPQLEKYRKQGRAYISIKKL